MSSSRTIAAPRPRKHLRRFRPVGLMAAGFLILLVGCDDDSTGSEVRDGTLLGDAVAVGDGTAHSYITLQDGVPVELGFALDAGALQNLPREGMPAEYLLQLPAAARNVTPFDHLTLDWNPHGHEPQGIYDQPHFDFHFYVLSEAEREAILPSDPQFQTKAERFPASEFLPAGYITPPPVTAIPRMGVHWVDPTATELQGTPFTQTLIYGSWNGRVAFLEPMATRTYLETRPDFTGTIPQPQRFSPTGRYPTRYGIHYDADSQEYRISVSNFVMRS